MQSSQLIIIASALLSWQLVLLYPISADYVNYENQIEERASEMGRPYAIKRCSPCGPNECKVMGMQRYSEPRCEALSGLGAPCRMWQEPDNKTLHFPNFIMRCNDVYMQTCPCAQGLVCEEAECRFPERQRDEKLNELSAPIADETIDEFHDETTDEPSKFRLNKSLFPWAVARFH